MKSVIIASVAAWVVAVSLGGMGVARAAEETKGEGVALAIVYDTSGSMKDLVPDGAGKRSPKYKIANRALESIAKQIEAFASRPGQGAHRNIQAGLFIFDGSGTRQAVPFGPFNAKAMIDWARKFNSPGSGTPLGNALQAASDTVLKSNLSRKHVLVITDGVNTAGPAPEAVLPGIKKRAAEKQTELGIHFVAFDVDAGVFSQVKKQGATVLGAANEVQLTTQLQAIMREKILLEEEEPPRKN